MSHYDVFGRFYDASVELLYRPHRERAAELMDLATESWTRVVGQG